MIFYVLQRKIAEPGRQWICAVVVGNTQRALEIDPTNCILVDFRKLKNEFVVFQLDHDYCPFASLPLTVFDIPCHAKNGVVGDFLQLAQKLRKELRAPHDDLLQVGGHLSSKREQDILVLL